MFCVLERPVIEKSTGVSRGKACGVPIGADGFDADGEGSLNLRRLSKLEVRSELLTAPLAGCACEGGVSTGLMMADG